MKPVFQTEAHNPPKTIGNCFTACLASIFELQIKDVPHFARMVVDANKMGKYDESAYWLKIINEWLKQYNLYYSAITPPTDKRIQKPRGFHIIEGYSNRLIRHAAVAKNGVIVHDPYKDGGGFKSIYSFGIFVQIDPSKRR